MRSEGWSLQFEAQSRLTDGAKLTDLSKCSLAPEEVRIRGDFSSITFKDFLVVSGSQGFKLNQSRGVGTDYVGKVVDSNSSKFSAGENVGVLASDLGSGGPGGVCEYIVAHSSQVMSIPDGWTPRELISAGTPLLTAALAFERLGQDSCEKANSIVLSGAGSGVGLFSLMLANLREISSIFAISSKSMDYFNSLHLRVNELYTPDKFERVSSRALLPEKWHMGIDVMGGSVLEAILKACKKKATVITLGVVQSSRLETDLAPFFLREVNLRGINLQSAFTGLSASVWRDARLLVDQPIFNELITDISVNDVAEELLARSNGTGHGRALVNLKSFDQT